MDNTLFQILTAVLPLAVTILPILIATFVAAVIVKLAMRALPLAEAPRNMILRTAGIVQSASLTVLGLFFTFMLITVNLTAFQAQQSFESFKAEQHRR